jgi:hypothetical protein
MERLLEFCLGKIPDEDLMTLEEMLAKGVPDRVMASDAAIKRRTKLAMDCQSRGYKVVQKRVAMDIVQDRDAILAMNPDMFRLGGSQPGAITAAMPLDRRTRQPTLSEADHQEIAKTFPHMARKH